MGEGTRWDSDKIWIICYVKRGDDCADGGVGGLLWFGACAIRPRVMLVGWLVLLIKYIYYGWFHLERVLLGRLVSWMHFPSWCGISLLLPKSPSHGNLLIILENGPRCSSRRVHLHHRMQPDSWRSDEKSYGIQFVGYIIVGYFSSMSLVICHILQFQIPLCVHVCICFLYCRFQWLIFRIDHLSSQKILSLALVKT